MFFGNFAYLSLSVSFIQILKVSHLWPPGWMDQQCRQSHSPCSQAQQEQARLSQATARAEAAVPAGDDTRYDAVRLLCCRAGRADHTPRSFSGSHLPRHRCLHATSSFPLHAAACHALRPG